MRKVYLVLACDADDAYLVTDVFIVWMIFAADRLFVRIHMQVVIHGWISGCEQTDRQF
jgi:hypothetical protein